MKKCMNCYPNKYDNKYESWLHCGIWTDNCEKCMKK